MYNTELSDTVTRLKTCIGNSFGCCNDFNAVLSGGKMLREDGKEVIFFGEGFDTSLIWTEVGEPTKMTSISDGCEYDYDWSQKASIYIKLDRDFCANLDIDKAASCLSSCISNCNVKVLDNSTSTLLNCASYPFISKEQKESLLQVCDKFYLLKFTISITGQIFKNNCPLSNCIC
jgi:hypothetical protein